MGKFLKPAPGRDVPQQDGSPWPADGMDAPNNLYIRRRLRDGDLIEAERPAEPAAAPQVVDPPADTVINPPAGKGKGDK